MRQLEDAAQAAEHALAILPPPPDPDEFKGCAVDPAADARRRVHDDLEGMLGKVSLAYAHATDILAAKPLPPPPAAARRPPKAAGPFVAFSGQGRVLGGAW